MSKDEALKLALSCIKSSAEYKRGNATFVETAEDIEQALAAPVHFAWMRYEADCAGDPVLVLARSTEEGAFKVYKEPPAAQPAPEQYAALEQALTRLQKRYGELEARLAAQPATEESSEVQPAPVAWMHEWEDGERVPMLRKRDVDSSDIDSPKSVRPLVFGDTTSPTGSCTGACG